VNNLVHAPCIISTNNYPLKSKEYCSKSCWLPWEDWSYFPKLFGFQTFHFWAYLMKVIPEIRRAHYIRYLRLFLDYNFDVLVKYEYLPIWIKHR